MEALPGHSKRLHLPQGTFPRRIGVYTDRAPEWSTFELTVGRGPDRSREHSEDALVRDARKAAGGRMLQDAKDVTAVLT
jgi:hypothetical protein